MCFSCNDINSKNIVYICNSCKNINKYAVYSYECRSCKTMLTQTTTICDNCLSKLYKCKYCWNFTSNNNDHIKKCLFCSTDICTCWENPRGEQNTFFCHTCENILDTYDCARADHNISAICNGCTKKWWKNYEKF